MGTLEKYLNYGYNSLNDVEIIEILLYLSGYKNPKKKINKLLSYYGSCENILLDSLNKNKKLNKKFLILNKLLKDNSINYIHDKMISNNDLLNNSKIVVEFFRRKIAFINKEKFYILMLNNSNKYITYKVISKGTIDRAYIFIRDIFNQVLDCNVKNIIICHNHPSGSLEPSTEDKNVTLKIKTTLNLFDINLLDHIIVSSNGYYSFAERGLI